MGRVERCTQPTPRAMLRVVAMGCGRLADIATAWETGRAVLHAEADPGLPRFTRQEDQ